MKPSEINALDFKGICSIIDACGKAGVSSLKLGNQIELTFHSLRSGEPSTEPQIPYALQQAGQPQQEPKVLETPEQKALQKDLEDSQLMLNDPLAYEEKMIGEDLLNAPDEPGRS